MHPTLSRLTFALAVALMIPGLAQAQAGAASAKIATVNGVAIPKSRVRALAEARQTGLNEVVAELLEKGLGKSL